MPLPAPEEAVPTLPKAWASGAVESAAKNVPQVDFVRMLEEFGRANECPPVSTLPRPTFGRGHDGYGAHEPSSAERLTTSVIEEGANSSLFITSEPTVDESSHRSQESTAPPADETVAPWSAPRAEDRDPAWWLADEKRPGSNHSSSETRETTQTRETRVVQQSPAFTGSNEFCSSPEVSGISTAELSLRRRKAAPVIACAKPGCKECLKHALGELAGSQLRQPDLLAVENLCRSARLAGLGTTCPSHSFEECAHAIQDVSFLGKNRELLDGSHETLQQFAEMYVEKFRSSAEVQAAAWDALVMSDFAAVSDEGWKGEIRVQASIAIEAMLSMIEKNADYVEVQLAAWKALTDKLGPQKRCKPIGQSMEQQKDGLLAGGVTRVAAKILDHYGRVNDSSAARVRDVLIGFLAMPCTVLDVEKSTLRASDLTPEGGAVLKNHGDAAWDMMLGFLATPCTGAAASPLQDIPARRWLCGYITSMVQSADEQYVVAACEIFSSGHVLLQHECADITQAFSALREELAKFSCAAATAFRSWKKPSVRMAIVGTLSWIKSGLLRPLMLQLPKATFAFEWTLQALPETLTSFFGKVGNLQDVDQHINTNSDEVTLLVLHGRIFAILVRLLQYNETAAWLFSQLATAQVLHLLPRWIKHMRGYPFNRPRFRQMAGMMECLDFVSAKALQSVWPSVTDQPVPPYLIEPSTFFDA
jgi:hypothetical protein